MRILLDTSAYIKHFNGVPAFMEKVAASDEVLMSPIAIGELMLGFRNGSRFHENANALRRFLGKDVVQLVPVNEVTADRYSRIALHLRRQGTPIPSNDMWIAAQAMEHGAELLTADRHFEQISGLVCTVFG
ncbi:MAG: PilT domain protein [Actinobacteria bacterium]|nr:PilT domain protein [Actinomycetota bacterium]MBM2828176.1 PilT domain protein [Actinomycetota bacterium]